MVLVIRGGLQILLVISLKYKWIDYFQICLILEAKLADNSSSSFRRFKQIQGNSTTGEIGKKYFG